MSFLVAFLIMMLWASLAYAGAVALTWLVGDLL